jgi:hypothetical protein
MRAIPRLPAVATAAVTAFAAFAAPLGAQTDDEILARYRLTEAGLVKFTQASRNFIAIAKADSAALEQQSEDSDGMTLAQMAALYDGHPGLKRAITSAGMTTREYVTFIMSMFQAGMGAWMVEQQGGKFDKVPAGFPHENIRFYQQHRAALEAIGEELKEIEGRKSPDEEG